MLLIDSNQVFISSIIQAKSPDSEDLIKHIVLNSLRANVKKFKEYGEVVLCSDSRQYWRKSIFPHYKAHRKESREKSNLNWDLIFSSINQLKDDIRGHFPYKFVEVHGAEADDIIGTLAPRFSSHEPVMIVSSDKDFVQLQKYPNVKQYNPMLNVYVTSKNPIRDLKEKIIRGDAGDGIPNTFSNDDVFVTKTRQKPVSNKKLEEWLEQNPKDFLNETEFRNFTRNQMLIDFDYIPSDIREKIVDVFENAPKGSKGSLYKYFVSKKMINLLDVIEDF
jgi:5'-3' exonuclease, N-terminal resolvase-like domain/T4 RNase H, C terminal